MKVSYNWLQSFFDKKLPNPEKLAGILTMHSFEVEAVEKKKNDYIFDIDVLPNRAHDCLSHEGIAKEVSALLGFNATWDLPSSRIAIKGNSFRKENSNPLTIDVKEPNLCRRYLSIAIDGIKVGQSPKWLRERLESINQRSINNVVDILNFVMFDMGQPMHAFDADKVQGNIEVRKAIKGEKIITLDNQEIELDEDTLIIADGDGPLALAGIKGGKMAEVDNSTKNIILEAANFEPVNIRKTSRRVGIRNDSSLRFENEITPELAEYALMKAAHLILKEAGGKAGIKKDFYPKRANPYKLGVHPRDISGLLGIEIPEKDIVNILGRFGFEIKKINPIKNVLMLAKSLRGKPYKYGASISFDAPESFDCSSFVSYVFAHSGAQIPRMTIDQYFYGKPVEQKDLKPGDLIFSNTLIGKIHRESKEFMKGIKMKNGIDHCGIYLGNGKVIHSSRYNSDGVIIEDLKKSKQFKNLRGFRRMITEADDMLLVTVPFNRLDVRRKEDLAEEVGRLYGYENIPSKLPEGVLIPAVANENYSLSEKIKDIFVGAGFSEVYNYSFANNGDIELKNPIAKDRGYLRTNLADGLSRNIEENLKYFDNVKIFELGEVFQSQNTEDGASCILEKKMIGGALAYKDKKKNKEHEVFYEIKGVLTVLFEKLCISDVWFSDDGEDVALIKIDNEILGIVNNGIWEIDFEKLKKVADEEREYTASSKYPAAVRDLSIFVPNRTKVEDVLDIIENTAGKLLFDTDLFDIYEAPDRKSFAFRLVFQSYDKTLSDSEINEIMDKIIKALEENADWEVRKG